MQDKFAQQMIRELRQRGAQNFELDQTSQDIRWQDSNENTDYLLVSDTHHGPYLCLVSAHQLSPTTSRCTNPYTRVAAGSSNTTRINAIRKLAQKLVLPHRLLASSAELHQEALLQKLQIDLRLLPKHQKPTKLTKLTKHDERNAYTEHAEKSSVIALDKNLPIVHAGDRLELMLTNHSDRALDITILMLDSAYGVKRLFPTLPGANRIEAGGQFPIALYVTPNPRGLEDMLIFVSEVQPLRISDFSFLTQDAFAGASLDGKMIAAHVRSQRNALQELQNLIQRNRPYSQRGQAETSLPRTAVAQFTWMTK